MPRHSWLRGVCKLWSLSCDNVRVQKLLYIYDMEYRLCIYIYIWYHVLLLIDLVHLLAHLIDVLGNVASYMYEIMLRYHQDNPRKITAHICRLEARNSRGLGFGAPWGGLPASQQQHSELPPNLWLHRWILALVSRWWRDVGELGA